MAKKQENPFDHVDIRKLPILHTGPAEVNMAFLTEPSTAFNEDGVYTVRIRLPEDSPEAKKLCKLIDKARDEAYTTACEFYGKKNLKRADPSYKVEEDDEGNETGYVLFNFKRNATYKDKNDNLKAINLPLFDSMGQKVDKEGLEIWRGSTVAVAFRLKPFYVPSLGCGVTHRLEAVQVIKAVSGGERTADEYGFSTQAPDFPTEEEDGPSTINEPSDSTEDGDY